VGCPSLGPICARIRSCMSHPDEDRPNSEHPVSRGQRWICSTSPNCVRLGDTIDEIAGFLCRSRREVRDKIAELKQSGELERRVREIAANARPEGANN
jgi:hypothetical protein